MTSPAPKKTLRRATKAVGADETATRYQQLRSHLATLKLHAAAESLPQVLEEAAAQNLSPTATLETLLRIEVEDTEARRLTGRLRFANLPTPASLENFDADAASGIDRPLLDELGTCRFLETATNVLLIGTPGTGKTHLATGLARAAAHAGYRTYFTTAADLAARCHRAAIEGRWATTNPRVNQIRGSPYIPDGHPTSGSFFVREQAVIEHRNIFLNEHVFSDYRRNLLAASDIDTTARRDRDQHLAALRRDITETETKSKRLIRTLELVDEPDQELIRDINERRSELRKHRAQLHDRIAELEAEEMLTPTRPDPD